MVTQPAAAPKLTGLKNSKAIFRLRKAKNSVRRKFDTKKFDTTKRKIRYILQRKYANFCIEFLVWNKLETDKLETTNSKPKNDKLETFFIPKSFEFADFWFRVYGFEFVNFEYGPQRVKTCK